MAEPVPALAYALPDLNRRRWSKLAVVSLLIPILAVPAIRVGSASLYHSRYVSYVWAQWLSVIALGIAAFAGLVATAASLHRIRSSAGRLRGRMLALIGLALDIVLLFMVVMLLYLQHDR